jgi:hypothetical protein
VTGHSEIARILLRRKDVDIHATNEVTQCLCVNADDCVDVLRCWRALMY